MLKLDLTRLCRERGIGSMNQFLIECGLTDYMATRLLGERLNSLNFKYLEIICLHLHCTIDDLFAWTPDNNTLNDHPLNKLKRVKTDSTVLKQLRGLPLDKLDQVREFINALEKSKTDKPQ